GRDCGRRHPGGARSAPQGRTRELGQDHSLDRHPAGMSSPFLAAGTPVVVIAGTGRYGSAQIAGMRAAGTNIVANVTPGRGGRGGGEIDGIPTFDPVGAAVAQCGARAAVIYAPPGSVRDAIVECAEAGIACAVAAGEFVPIHDTLFALARARASGMWVVGPNS